MGRGERVGRAWARRAQLALGIALASSSVGGCREGQASGGRHEPAAAAPPAPERAVHPAQPAGVAPQLGAAGPAGAARAASALTPRHARLELSLIDDYNPPRRPPLEAEALARRPRPEWDAALGGLSALHYSEADGLLYAVSDDPRRFPPRLYTFEVELASGSLRVRPRSVILLREQRPTGALVELDAEGLAGDGRALFLSAESNDDHPTQRESRVVRLGRDGLVIGGLPVPSAFRPAPPGQSPRGTRSNLGFEGLSVSPSGRWLWAVAEAALAQDGPLASFDAGTTVRMARWDLTGGTPPRELLYRTEPVAPRLEHAAVQHNGVSELVAVDDQRLLVLERAYVAAGERGTNRVVLFEVDVDDALLAGAEPPLVEKHQVLDLGDLVDRFDEGLQQLDNFEGMTLGPRLPSGNPSLLIVSDDNFSADQRTVFLAFELRVPGR